MTFEDAMDRISHLVEENKALKHELESEKAKSKQATDFAEKLVKKSNYEAGSAEYYRDLLDYSMKQTETALALLKRSFDGR